MRGQGFLKCGVAAMVVSGMTSGLGAPASAKVMTAERAEAICSPFFNDDEEGRYGFQQAMAASPIAAPPQQESIMVTARRRTEADARLPSPPPRPMPFPATPENRERYDGKEVADIMAVAQQPVSTFSVDVDTGSYTNVRRLLKDGKMPPEAAVRTEEMINYFKYDYDRPEDRTRPFSITTDVAATPWNDHTRLLRIGLRGYDVDRDERPAANLVFLVDVSGSMRSRDKLPLVKCSMAMMAEELKPTDRVSIVTYAGTTTTVLEGSHDKEEIIAALSNLRSGGSTAGAAGIQLAYDAARKNMLDDGINRILLATDGDFNVGTTNRDQLVEMVEREREAGISLTTLGFGTGNYNEAMMEQIADNGNGNYAYIDSPMEAWRALVGEMSSTLFTIAKDVKMQVEFNPAYITEYRLIGYENRLLGEEDFANDAVDAGEIGAGHQVTALYELVPAGSEGWLPERRYEANRPAAEGAEDGEMAYLKLRYKLPDGDKSLLIERPLAADMLAKAQGPEGDMAFVTAVAAYGQKLRGDKYLGDFGYQDNYRIAQNSPDNDDYWRDEFMTLVMRAQSLSQPGGEDERKAD